MKKSKRGIEISHWKVQGNDAFASITPEWTDDELDIGQNKEEDYDADQNNIDSQIQELTNKNIHKRK